MQSQGLPLGSDASPELRQCRRHSCFLCRESAQHLQRQSLSKCRRHSCLLCKSYSSWRDALWSEGTSIKIHCAAARVSPINMMVFLQDDVLWSAAAVCCCHQARGFRYAAAVAIRPEGSGTLLPPVFPVRPRGPGTMLSNIGLGSRAGHQGHPGNPDFDFSDPPF